MGRPQHIKNEQLWRKHCRQIVARSHDLIAGRLGVIETAREMYKLSFWVGARADPDFALFKKIADESGSLPIGKVQNEWALSALAALKPRIDAIENTWRSQALAAARNLVAKYEWSLKKNLRRDRASGAAGNIV